MMRAKLQKIIWLIAMAFSGSTSMFSALQVENNLVGPVLFIGGGIGAAISGHRAMVFHHKADTERGLAAIHEHIHRHAMALLWQQETDDDEPANYHRLQCQFKNTMDCKEHLTKTINASPPLSLQSPIMDQVALRIMNSCTCPETGRCWCVKCRHKDVEHTPQPKPEYVLETGRQPDAYLWWARSDKWKYLYNKRNAYTDWIA